MLDQGLRQTLMGVVGPAHVLDDPELTASYEVDWTGRFRGRAAAVVRPGSTGEVAGVLGLLNEDGRPVVLQGGNTGLVGGGIPHRGEVVLSLTRLRDVGPVDPLTEQVTVGAGVTLAGVHDVAAGAGLAFGVDLAARDSATTGGMVATNAGGLRVIRYGDMRANVVGLEVVLAGGSVLAHLSGLTKDNTGYHLPGLFAGSEGTLGVVTRARLRLVADDPQVVVALLGL
ncbi:MAG: FAD-binding oxidoreductase, partial [Acidimicrobiia bacterium]